MPYPSRRWLESLAHTLMPPDCAEHALGDLAECSSSSGEYLRTLASILPRVVWSQIRRRATLGGLVFHAIVTAFALMAFQGFPKSPFFTEPWAGLRLAAPWAIWVIGCALAAAYGPREKPTCWNRKVFVGTTLAAIGSAALLGVPVARVVMALGATFGTLLVLSMPWLTRQKPPPLAPGTLVEHARTFQRGIWWRNARESIACGVVIALNVRSLLQAETALDRAGNALLIAGVGFIMGFLHLRAGSRRVPAEADARTIWQFHRRELARQRDILRAIVWWYLLPFVPGMIVSSAAKSERIAPALVGMVVVIGVFAFIWRLNLWGARWLDCELQKVDGLEGQL